MVKLNDEVKSVFSKVKLFPVATASKKGIPNVTPISFVQLIGDDTIWIGDNFMVKTLANLKENPYLSVYVYDPDVKKCFQIKGTVEIKTSGADFEKMKATIKAKNEKLPAKSLLVVKITDVFDCMHGATAGKKIL